MALPRGVTQRDIAEHLGIAVSTVSRALSDNPRVSRVTREAVRRAARELDAQRASLEPSSAPLMIGVTHSHSYHGLQNHNHESVLEQVLGGVEVACRRYNAVPYPWQQSHLLASAESDTFFARVSGVIMSGGEIDDEVVSAIHAHDKPIVLIGGHLPDAPLSSVAADSMNGMYRAARHLIELGHRRIAFVNGPNTSYTSREKLAGYLAALADHDVPFDPVLMVARDDRGGFMDDASEALARSVLGLADRPTAVIFATDAMARAGYRVCRELGLSIPGDVSLVGFHDDDAAFADPPMTSVRVDRYAWGVAAAELLMRIIAGQEGQASRTLLPVELVSRESSASPSEAATIRQAAG